MPDHIKTERDEHVWKIFIDRPAERNAFDVQTIREFSDAYTEFEKDNDLRCALVLANGKHFTLGLELDAVSDAFQKEGGLRLPDGNIDPWGVFGPRTTKPVVIAAHGFCFTLGIELMLASDIRIAARGTRFSQAEVTRGIIPFGGATLRFVEQTGWGNAMRYILTGEDFPAEEALRIGLVQEVVEKKDLAERGLALAKLVAKQAPLAVQSALASSREYMAQIETPVKSNLTPTVLRLMNTEDAAEGVASFKEKRAPIYRGK